MRKLFLFTLAVALILCGCAAPAQAPNDSAQPQQAAEPEPAAEPAVEAATAFDLDAYKSAVDQFRRDVMDNAIYVGNMARAEMNYLNAAKQIGSNPDSETVLSKAAAWLEEQADISLSDVETANDQIKNQYADLIITEIEGKEAEELDTYIRQMYKGYSSLYTAATSASPLSYESFALEVRDALTSIQDANQDISLFCGEYGK